MYGGGNTFEGIPSDVIRDDGMNTVVLPKFHSASFNEAVLKLIVSGLPGVSYRVEHSGDLSVWEALDVVHCPPSGRFEIEQAWNSELDGAAPVQTFFRAVSLMKRGE